MAKAFLLRFGSEIDFNSIKLQTRELGVAIDSEKLYLGFEDRNVHIPNENFVKSLVDRSVNDYTHASGTTQELVASQKVGAIGFDTTLNTITYKKSSAESIKILTQADALSYEQTSIEIASENIDTGDNESVSLTSFKRPNIILFVNGRLCPAGNVSGKVGYVYNQETFLMKVYGIKDLDVISYF